MAQLPTIKHQHIVNHVNHSSSHHITPLSLTWHWISTSDTFTSHIPSIPDIQTRLLTNASTLIQADSPLSLSGAWPKTTCVPNSLSNSGITTWSFCGRFTAFSSWPDRKMVTSLGLMLWILLYWMRMLEKFHSFHLYFCGKMWGIAAYVHENHVTWFALSTYVAMNTIYESKCEHAKIHVLQWPKAHYTRFKGWYEVSFLLNPLRLITRKRNDKLQERESQPDKANPEIPQGR